MYVQTLIALAVVVGMAVTIILLGRSPKRPRRMAQPSHDPGATPRPNVTQYSERGTQSR